MKTQMPEDDERQADDPADDRIDPVGQERAEEQRGQAEDRDDRGVAEGVQRSEQDRVAVLAGQPTAGRDGDRDRSGDGRQGRGARTQIVGMQLSRPAVLVTVTLAISASARCWAP